MIWLIAGLALFIGVHSVQIFAPRARETMIARLGAGPWKGLYSLVSLIGFGLIIFGYSQARGAPLYGVPTALMPVALVLVWLGFIGVTAAYWPGNHIKRWLGDPMVFGVGLWALGHLLATATPAAVALFGAFLTWAVADFISLRRRSTARTAALPRIMNTFLAVTAGSILAGAFVFWLHRLLIGIAPVG